MSTKINFSFGGNDYCLEYNKRTVKQMEDRGFALTKFMEAPMSTLPELFAGAFLANHKFTKRQVIDDIYDHMSDKQTLINTLTTMYNEPIEALMSDGDDEGNGIAWTATT